MALVGVGVVKVIDKHCNRQCKDIHTLRPNTRMQMTFHLHIDRNEIRRIKDKLPSQVSFNINPKRM